MAWLQPEHAPHRSTYHMVVALHLQYVALVDGTIVCGHENEKVNDICYPLNATMTMVPIL